MNNEDTKDPNRPALERGYWGKYETINGEIRKIYIGILTREEMLEYDDTFRHNFAIEPPKVEPIEET